LRFEESGHAQIVDIARQKETRVLRHPTACDTSGCDGGTEPGESTCALCRQSQAEFEQWLIDSEEETYD